MARLIRVQIYADSELRTVANPVNALRSDLKCLTWYMHPLLHLHPKVIDVSHGVDLFSRCSHPAPPYWVPDAHHNDVFEVTVTEPQIPTTCPNHYLVSIASGFVSI